MPEETSVQINFGASTDEAIAGIAQIREALSGLTAPVAGVSGNLDRLGESFGAALPLDLLSESAKSLGNVGAAAQGAAQGVQGIGAAAKSASAGVESVSSQLKIAQIHLSEQKVLLDAEVSQYQVTQNQKFALLEAETQKEYELLLAQLEKKKAAEAEKGEDTSAVDDKISVLHAKHDADMVRLDEQSIAAQKAQWNTYLSTVTSAFNSQLRGLLEGTTSWHKAMQKMLEDLTIKFIEMAEDDVKNWLAAELAKTTATTTGAAARAAAEQSASDAGILGTIANALKAIFAGAAQTGAGVSAAVAPEAGPAAPAIGAAAMAAVVATSTGAIYDVGTDYVVRGGLAVIHPGETIVPAGLGWAAGSGPYTGGGSKSGDARGGDTHFHIAAVDAQSVSRFFNDNAGHMMRAINKAIRSGTHLNPRYAR